MSRKINLQIHEPCHADWDAMTQSEKGKFCNACQKAVIDFTGMSDQQLVAFFKTPPAAVCGRFQKDQLNRDIAVPGKRIPWLKYFFQFTLPAFLLFLKASAQREVMGKLAPVSQNIVVGTSVMQVKGKPVLKTTEIKGRVVDEKGEGISRAVVMIKRPARGTVCDAAGHFKLKLADTAKVSLIASATGFEDRDIVLSDSSIVEIQMAKNMSDRLGEVFLGGISTYRVRSRSIPLLGTIFRDVPFSKFRVYPNPAVAGSVLNIQFNKKEKDDYKLQLFDQSGQLIVVGEIGIKDESLLNIRLPFLAAGTYFLLATHKKTGKKYTEKFIVQ